MNKHSESIVSLSHIKKGFSNRLVLTDVSCDFYPGEVVGLVGPSGAGKSVLLKIIAGIMEVDGGTINREKAHSVGFLFQEGALFDSMTVLENVVFALESKSRSETGAGISLDEAVPVAMQAITAVGLKEAYQKLPGQLSGGMRRRVGIARAIVTKPNLVLLDDPTGGLDPVASTVIMSVIKELHASYRPTVVMVSHDMRRLIPSVSRIIALFDGKIVTDVSADSLPQAASPEVVSFIQTRYDFSKNHSSHSPS